MSGVRRRAEREPRILFRDVPEERTSACRTHRFWLAAHIEALPAGHPRKRHVCFMALYARDILIGELPGPYTDTDAERFARLALRDPDVTQLARSATTCSSRRRRRGPLAA
jgi:hypothetical protein